MLKNKGRFNLKHPLIPLSLLILIDHMGLGIIFPVLVAIFMDPNHSIVGADSNLVSEDKQGWMMGVTEAIVAVSWAITPIASSYLESVALSIPLSMAAGLLTMGTLMLKYWKPQSATSPALDLDKY